MDRKTLESAGPEYSYLRGLFMIPLGLLPILSALANTGWGGADRTWVFFGALVAIAAVSLVIYLYYSKNYGRVRLSTRQQMRAGVTSLIVVPIYIGASFLARSRVDWSLHLPVNTTAALLALSMLTGYAVTVGLKAHHLIIFGALLIAGSLPVWGGADPSNTGFLMAGAAIIVSGILDHRLLVRNFGSSGRLNLADGDVGA